MKGKQNEIRIEDVKVILANHDYEIQGEIGSGGYSSCFRVQSAKYNQTFVCKISTNKIAYNLELEILTVADHPNIVRCYDFFSSDKYFFLILEDCINGSLDNYVKVNGPLSGGNLHSIFFQIFDAILFLHSNNIAHLDIKPSNIFLDKYNRVKVGDFGISRIFNQEKLSHVYSGTKIYRAPEVELKKPYDPFKADVWSLGVTIYYLLVGHQIANSADELRTYLKSGFFYFISNTPTYLRNLVYTCVKQDPTQRANLPTLMQILYKGKSAFEAKTHIISSVSSFPTVSPVIVVPRNSDSPYSFVSTQIFPKKQSNVRKISRKFNSMRLESPVIKL